MKSRTINPKRVRASAVRSEDGAEYGATKAADLRAENDTIKAALAILEARLGIKGAALTSPDAVRDYLRLQLTEYPYEVFAVLLLDNRHRVIRYEELFRGTIDGASVHPREVVRHVMGVNAAAVIFAHNHPSGVAEPSQADLRITQRLKDALALIEVKVLDHVIVGDSGAVSLAERGQI